MNKCIQFLLSTFGCDHSSSGTIITCVNGNDIKRIDGDYGTIISKLQFTEKERYENIKENGQLAGFIDEAIAAGDGQWIVDYIRSKGKVAAWEFQSMNSSKGRMPRNDAGNARKRSSGTSMIL
ncbi:hypothetical protein QVM87_20180 [Providencia stuartii]|nr:hypothetical protein [Providencia stuartii]